FVSRELPHRAPPSPSTTLFRSGCATSSTRSCASSSLVERSHSEGPEAMTMNDVMFLDATAQADLVRRKEVSASELVEAAIERIEIGRASCRERVEIQVDGHSSR